MRLVVSAIVIASLVLPTSFVVEPKELINLPATKTECAGVSRKLPECAQPLKWFFANSIIGYATTYDAFYWLGHQSWFSLDKNGNPGKNAWLHETKESCNKHPEWNCYTVRMHGASGSWLQYRRPWTSTLENLYAAVGPLLQSLIPKQLARYHKIPTNKLRITSLETNRSVEVWIADTCPCEGYVVSDGKKIHPLVDLSPEAWAEMGRETYYINGKRYYRNALTGAQWGSNWITVEYLP